MAKRLQEAITVYNFEVEDWHTYIVSSSQVLVHNTCGPGAQGTGGSGSTGVKATSTSPTPNPGTRDYGTYSATNPDAHHIIQNASVRDLPGYSRSQAPAIQLRGPSTLRGSEHYKATRVQDQRGGGTYASERRIGYKALRRAGLSREEARFHIQRADDYFSSIGVGPNTILRIPGNRR